MAKSTAPNCFVWLISTFLIHTGLGSFGLLPNITIPLPTASIALCLVSCVWGIRRSWTTLARRCKPLGELHLPMCLICCSFEYLLSFQLLCGYCCCPSIYILVINWACCCFYIILLLLVTNIVIIYYYSIYIYLAPTFYSLF